MTQHGALEVVRRQHANNGGWLDSDSCRAAETPRCSSTSSQVLSGGGVGIKPRPFGLFVCFTVRGHMYSRRRRGGGGAKCKHHRQSGEIFQLLQLVWNGGRGRDAGGRWHRKQST